MYLNLYQVLFVLVVFFMRCKKMSVYSIKIYASCTNVALKYEPVPMCYRPIQP